MAPGTRLITALQCIKHLLDEKGAHPGQYDLLYISYLMGVIFDNMGSQI